MLKLTVFILIFSVWQVLLDQCCKRKILNGKEYQLRETNDEAASKHGCLDNCVYEDSENATFCFKSGSFPAQCIAPPSTSSEVEQGFTNLTVRDGNQGYLCNLNFNFILNQTFQLESESSTACFPWNNLTESLEFLEENKFQIKTRKGLDLDCKMIPIFSASESGSIRFADKSVHKTLNCEVSAESCLTNNGSVFPAKCEPTFRYEGREYHACTDQGLSEDDDRLWCATEVDDNYNLVDGKWGFCSSKCSYCGGSPINDTKERTFYRPCGYDCLVNVGKIMDGSSGTRNLPLLSPTATLHGEYKENFIKDVQGQIQLNIGEQMVRLTCPLTKFVDPDLNGVQTVFLVCGPKQYRFTVYSIAGKILHEEFKNNRFGCDPCPNTFHFVPGYMSSRHSSHRGTSFSILNVDECEDRCYDSKSCKSFSFSSKDQTCKLFSDIIVEPTYASNYEDYVTCSKDAGCCEETTISSTGGTAEFQSNRLGKFVQSGRHNNRIVYKQEEGSKILFYSGYKEYGWVVGSDFDSLGGLRTLSGSDSVCPDERFSWDYYSGVSWIPDASIKIACKDINIEDFIRVGEDELREQAFIDAMKDGSYQQETSEYKEAAYALLRKSILIPEHYKESSKYLQLFHHSILPEFNKKEFEVFDCRQKPKPGEKVFEVPKKFRLRNVIHEIGYLMLQFGKINPSNDYANYMSRKLIRVDNFLYEILLSKEGNLYDNPVLCYYSKKPSSAELSKERCVNIIKEYKDVKEKAGGVSKDGLEYKWYKETIKDKKKDMIYDALKKLFYPEHTRAMDNIITNYYDPDLQELLDFNYFISEKFAIAIFLEVVRNIEILPITLELLMLKEVEEKQTISDPPTILQIFFKEFPTDIHPMTAGGTFYHNMREYELLSGGRMYGVGFFPTKWSLEDFEVKRDWKWRDWEEEAKKKRIKENRQNAWKVHEKAKAISDLYHILYPTVSGLIEAFFENQPGESDKNGFKIYEIEYAFQYSSAAE